MIGKITALLCGVTARVAADAVTAFWGQEVGAAQAGARGQLGDGF